MEQNRTASEPTREVAQVGAGDADSPPTTSHNRIRYIMIRLMAVALIISIGASLWVYRELNCSQMSDKEFGDQIHAATKRGVRWVVDHRDVLLGEEINIALLYMLQDMNSMHETMPFHEMCNQALRSSGRPRFWKKMLDPKFSVSKYEVIDVIDDQMLDYRWAIYALDPSIVVLDRADFEGLFDTERWEKRRLTHQLWALWHCRRLSNEAHVTDMLLDQICQRIAKENEWDLQMLDLNFQRIAFILMADRANMIRRRWIERVIEHQCTDGGWNDNWLGTTSMRHDQDPKRSNCPTTVQALYVLYLAQYRYANHFRVPAL